MSFMTQLMIAHGFQKKMQAEWLAMWGFSPRGEK